MPAARASRGPLRAGAALAVLTAFAGLVLVPAAPAGGEEAKEEAGIAVVAEALGHPPLSGTFGGMVEGGIVVQASTGVRTIPLDHLVRLAVAADAPATLAGEEHLRATLAGGEILRGRFARGAPDGMVLAAPDLGEVLLPLDALRTLVVVPAGAGPCHEPERFRAASPRDDVVHALSGDAVTGTLVSAAPEGLTVEVEGGRSRLVPWRDVEVADLANDPRPAPDGLVVEVETVEGSRLLADAPPRLEGADLVVTTRSLPDAPLRVPLRTVATLRGSGGSFVYASDLPFEGEHVPYYGADADAPFLGRWYEARADRRPSGCPLRLRGVVYRHGFAVQSLARIALRLDRRYAQFQVLFGVDDEALEVPDGGIVDARVLADGKVLWEAKDVRAGAPPRAVGPIDVSGVAALVLEVGYGAAEHRGDRATWADPILTRASPGRR